MILKENLHTHNKRCRHATGSVKDYAKYAIKNGLKTLGISDHAPLPNEYWPNVRMRMEELPSYYDEIAKTKIDFPELNILTAAECEYLPSFHSFFEDTLLGKYKFDYLIGSVHYMESASGTIDVFNHMKTAHELNRYKDMAIKLMESELFLYFAHPDVFMASHTNWDNDTEEISRTILEYAEKSNTPLEINCNGFFREKIVGNYGKRSPYPHPDFWKLASNYKIKVVISSDAHNPKDVTRGFEKGIKLAADFGLEIIQLYE